MSTAFIEAVHQVPERLAVIESHAGHELPSAVHLPVEAVFGLALRLGERLPQILVYQLPQRGFTPGRFLLQLAKNRFVQINRCPHTQKRKSGRIFVSNRWHGGDPEELQASAPPPGGWWREPETVKVERGKQ